jgi:hypothetical protein
MGKIPQHPHMITCVAVGGELAILHIKLSYKVYLLPNIINRKNISKIVINI